MNAIKTRRIFPLAIVSILIAALFVLLYVNQGFSACSYCWEAMWYEKDLCDINNKCFRAEIYPGVACCSTCYRSYPQSDICPSYRNYDVQKELYGPLTGNCTSPVLDMCITVSNGSYSCTNITFAKTYYADCLWDIALPLGSVATTFIPRCI